VARLNLVSFFELSRPDDAGRLGCYWHREIVPEMQDRNKDLGLAVTKAPHP
jgi:hypothetical protein